MKRIPYNIYIRFEELDALFKRNSSRQENLLMCGFASIDLITGLLGGIIKKGKKTDTDEIADLVKGTEIQFKLLDAYTLPFKEGGYRESYVGNIDNLKLLDLSFSEEVNRISLLYFRITEKTKIGLDDQVNEIRNHFGLPKLSRKSIVKQNDQELPDIAEAIKISEVKYFNSEDELFMKVHQISECWFNIALRELELIHKLINNPENNFDEIKIHFKSTYEILIYLADHVLLLEYMVVHDYHPLRVALRGASGGQSQQAHKLFAVAIKTYNQFLSLLESRNKKLTQVLEKPNENHKLVFVINSFSRIERALKNFFFQHYILSSNTIGSQSFGSIGYDLASLTDKFVDPIFKEIDQAKYDLTLKTNFQYGSIAGSLLIEKEDFDLNRKCQSTTSNEIISEVINSYFDAISSLDKSKWVNLFAENGYIEDPVGSRPYVGHNELAIFFKGVLRFFSELNMTIESTNRKEETTEVSWKAKAICYNGKEIAFQGMEAFQVSPAGKILAAKVYWSPSIIADQL